MDPVEKKKDILYPFALDENKNLVFIEDVDKEHRHDHTYTCPDCGHVMSTEDKDFKQHIETIIMVD